MELMVNLRWVDGKGNDISPIIECSPGFKDLFMRAYNDGVDKFNDMIEGVNNLFDMMYPDHEVDMDDPNDIYFQFIRLMMQPIADEITKKYLNSNVARFGYFGEFATFAIYIKEANRIVSFVMDPVKK